VANFPVVCDLPSRRRRAGSCARRPRGRPSLPWRRFRAALGRRLLEALRLSDPRSPGVEIVEPSGGFPCLFPPSRHASAGVSGVRKMNTTLEPVCRPCSSTPGVGCATWRGIRPGGGHLRISFGGPPTNAWKTAWARIVAGLEELMKSRGLSGAGQRRAAPRRQKALAAGPEGPPGRLARAVVARSSPKKVVVRRSPCRCTRRAVPPRALIERSCNAWVIVGRLFGRRSRPVSEVGGPPPPWPRSASDHRHGPRSHSLKLGHGAIPAWPPGRRGLVPRTEGAGKAVWMRGRRASKERPGTDLRRVPRRKSTGLISV